MKILFDTCVIIDVLQSRQPFCADGQKLFTSVAEGKIKGFITPNSVTDIFYLTHRALHDNKKAKKILGTLFEFFAIIDTTAGDCHNALHSSVADFEDAVVCACAEREKIDYIVTRNIKDYKNARTVKALTPKELTDKI